MSTRTSTPWRCVITKQADANTLETAESVPVGRAAAPAHPAARRPTDDHQRHVALRALRRRRGPEGPRPRDHSHWHHPVPIPAHLAQHAHRPRLDSDLSGLDLPGDVRPGLQPGHDLADGHGADDRHSRRRLDRGAGEHRSATWPGREPDPGRAQRPRARSAWRPSPSRSPTSWSTCRSPSCEGTSASCSGSSASPSSPPRCSR